MHSLLPKPDADSLSKNAMPQANQVSQEIIKEPIKDFINLPNSALLYKINHFMTILNEKIANNED